MLRQETMQVAPEKLGPLVGPYGFKHKKARKIVQKELKPIQY